MPVSKFLKACKNSQDTYNAFKDILQDLSTTHKRKKTHALLLAIRNHILSHKDPESLYRRYNFSFRQIQVRNLPQPLLLLQLPSIFSPEEWSYTFYEGLCRFPREHFEDKGLVELGCGNGWISIALARSTGARKIYGLDINPKAITCARINLFLNGLDGEGRAILDGQQEPLWERLEFHESDLLAYIRDGGIKLDRVVGCIPQVLSPDPEALVAKASESDSDQSLYDLSNYTEAHGYVEDQFGLGLIAKALEESVEVLRPSGSIILNLGGRPGTQVLEGLFRRRGFNLRKVWSTRVSQAGDTEIQALVEIENKSHHRFEFFMGLHSKDSISATTAQAYSKAGGKISHSLSVYEAHIPAHQQLLKILKYLAKDENSKLHESLDLSSSAPEVYLERLNFLADLSERFTLDRSLLYENTRGTKELRHNIADFLKIFYRTPIEPHHLLIAPSRGDLLANFIYCFRPKRILLDGDISKDILNHSLYFQHDSQIFEAPRRVELVNSLINAIQPEMVITCLSEHENETSADLTQLIKATAEHSCQLILDISDYFELSSQPRANAALEFMAKYQLPPHVTLVCGLVKNKVYQDLKLTFMICESMTTINYLEAAAELSYSRPPLLTQMYYNTIVGDLLSFHLAAARNIHETTKRDPIEIPTVHDQLAPEAKQAFQHPAIARTQQTITSSTTRLDYGENCSDIPDALIQGCYEAFIRKNPKPHEWNPTGEILQYLSQEYGLTLRSQTVTLGSGVAPIFAGLLLYLKTIRHSLVVPTGSYGEFVAAAQFYGVQVHVCPTKPESGYKFTPKELHQCLSTIGPAWVFLNAPIVNPSGSVYENHELSEIAQIIKSHQSGLILDATFAGLQHQGPQNSCKLARFLDGNTPWIFLMGVSKLFAAGGLRFGFACTNHKPLKEVLDHSPYAPPHFTVQYAIKGVLSLYNQKDPALISTITQQRLLLAGRAKKLSEILENNGWQVLPPQGGLFLIASPKEHFGKTISVTDANGSKKNLTIDGHTITEALLLNNNLLINSDRWTGIPGFCRFVLSVNEKDFQEGLEALKRFFSGLK